MFDADLAVIAGQIQAALADMGLRDYGEIKWSPLPFEGQWGVATAIGFPAAAAEARAVEERGDVRDRAAQIAQEIAVRLGRPHGFSRVEAARGYLNLYFEPSHYARQVVDSILSQGASFGRGQPKGERVMVEYSQPNTHKAFHVGHLRNVILGGAMANLLEFAGFDTVRANYIGDIGLHVIKWLWCYMNFHAGEEPAQDRTRWIGDIYAEAVRRVEEDPELEEEVRELFQRWDRRDPDVVALWEMSRQWSLEGFQQIYDQLGASFDGFFYESEEEETGKALVRDLIARGLAVDERPEGPVVVKLDELLGLNKEKYRVLVVLRSDGTSLYATKDLPLAIRKFREWKIDRSVYVVDVRQSLYFTQIFKLLELMGFEQARKCHHLSYEIVNLPGNVTMASREGTVVLFEDLLRETVSRAAQIVEQKNPSLAPEHKQAVARAVGLGALKYPMLAVDNNRIVIFDWEAALDFEGQAAPYIQYAHVRANSILAKAVSMPETTGMDYELESAEISLIDRLSRFPAEVQRASEDYRPLQMANYAFELARVFNDFYHQVPVLQASPETRAGRIRLVAAARQVLASALGLLGIEAPTVM